MNVLQSVLLGALQGVAEFLPISSSGHLAIAQKLFGLEEVPLLFDVILHLATLLAVVIFFRKRIGQLFGVLFRWIGRKPEKAELAADAMGICSSDKAGRKTIVAVIISTIITGVLGVVSSKLIPELPVLFVFIGFIVTSALLIVSAVLAKKKSADDSQNKCEGVTVLQSVVIGIFQGVGTLPGISRSGSTIAGGLFSGLNREACGEYSFIVSIPAILGAFLLELKDLDQMAGVVGILPLIAGFVTAFVTGYAALAILMKIIKKGRLEWFAAYLIPVAILGIIFLA